ncbi:MAG: A1S_2505 family phage non-structural protein [Janthinobacterium lividum]
MEIPVVPANYVFAFGSNLDGRHGAGAAKWARDNRGAIYGQGIGMQGNSYAIPTKDRSLKTLPLQQISGFIFDFLFFASVSPKKFFCSRIGCGLAGYKDDQIAPLFLSAYSKLRIKPNEMNCVFDPMWLKFNLPILEVCKNDLRRNRSQSNSVLLY